MSDEEGEPSSGISGMLFRFLKPKSAQDKRKSEEWREKVKEAPEEDGELPINIKEGRSLPNVRKRIGNLLALKHSGKQSYNDTELKQYWMPDSVSRECYNCGERFTTFRRRHHCRVCGQIFCSTCCNQHIPGKIMNCTGDLRVCSYCGRVVLSYLKSAELNSELSADHLSLLNELQSKFGDVYEMDGAMIGDGGGGAAGPTLVTPDREEARRKPSLGYTEEKFGTITRADARPSLRQLLDDIVSSGALTLSTHRYRLRIYHNVFPASHLVDVLLAQNKAGNLLQAIALGQALLKTGHIEAVSQETSSFANNHILYRVLPFEPVREEHDTAMEPEQDAMKTSSSSFNLDLDIEQKTAYVRRPNEQKSPKETRVDLIDAEIAAARTNSRVEPIDWNSVDPFKLDPSKREALGHLRASFEAHCSNYLRQVLNNEGVAQGWAEIIHPIACQVVENIHPEMWKSWAEAMDIRQYVQVKKVGGGERRECEIVNGVVCTKNLSHRKMPTRMIEPRILLLSSSIMFQRDEGKYLSLEPVIMQENDYICRVVSKIVNFRPNLVIVAKSVARRAQELLLQEGISLVLNVKSSVIERLARLTGADVLNSVDAHLGAPELGSCQLFQIRTFTTDAGRQKTLMLFEGCRHPELGCTILLRGGSAQELSKVKKAASAFLFACYNARLELSFHMDMGGLPPLEKDEFLEAPEEEVTETRSPKQSKPHTESTPKYQSKPVSDLSDPLRSTSSPLDSEAAMVSVTVPQETNRFRKVLDENILSISPYLKFALPYLETEVGRHCPLRSFFGRRLYISALLTDDVPSKNKTEETVIQYPMPTDKRLESVQSSPHGFVSLKMTCPVDAIPIQTHLASYRASGGRIPIFPSESYYDSLRPVPRATPRPDILDPSHHQRLAVLFCSYSPLSCNAPASCVDPRIAKMEMYGRMDIPLGLFLETYCFRPEYTCGSELCDTSVLEHTRRFVHEGGVVKIQLRSLREDLFHSAAIHVWTTCSKCSFVTQFRPLSPGARRLSFAKYLELRFHGDMYKLSDDCPHSLYQDHVHYFAYKRILAIFTYSKISTWEVCLPPKVLVTEREPYDEATKLEELKTWSLMGHQVFASIHNKITSFSLPEPQLSALKQQLQKEQSQFKLRVDDAQQMAMSATNVSKILALEDLIVVIKKNVAESAEEWNSRLTEAEALSKKEEKRRSIEFSKTAQNLLTEFLDGEKEITEESDAGELQYGEEANEPVQDMETESADTDDGEGVTQSVPNDDAKKNSDKKTMKTILSQLLPNSNLTQNAYIQFPMGPLEHYLLPLGTTVPLVVYEREPSSIIAYALNSHDYKIGLDQLNSRVGETSGSPTSKRKSGPDERTEERGSIGGGEKKWKNSYLRSSSSGSMDKSLKMSTEGSPNDVFADEEPKGDDAKNKSPKSQSGNIEVSFSDGSANFKVKIYYAEEFVKLRALVLPEGEEGFIRSLSRCVAWAASGGKSGSNFNKTKDDRFILKAMARTEIQQFLDFAPQYFAYISTRVTQGIPTLLGKILGVYRVVCRSERSNTTVKLLVMEHLFHGRLIRHKFDLKGSVRNRLVDTNNEAQSETVLLDENLINMTCDSPLYVLPHSKTVLMQAIHNDTQFLAYQSVMDYSLLVGLDETNSHLVLGIIDYIRGYTWDKKIETMVKRIGQAKEPTIIPAEDYKKRFIAAMHKYFLSVPDRWTDLGEGVDMDAG